jgi:anti-sigma B factor antagonist
MQMILKQYPYATIIGLGGDFLSEPDQNKLQQKVHDLATKGIKHVVIDLGKVNFINSCGLGSLVSTLTTMRRAAGDVRLVSVKPSVMDLFRMTQLDSVFWFYPSLESALSAILPSRT